MNPSPRESSDTSLALDAAGLPETGGPETEAQRRAFTALWLAGTERLEAAPADSLHRVRQQLGHADASGRANAAGRRLRPVHFIAAGGWAAAFVLGAWIFSQGGAENVQSANQPWPVAQPGNHPGALSTTAPPRTQAAGTPPALSDPDKSRQPDEPEIPLPQPGLIALQDAGALRKELSRLRAELAAAAGASTQPGVHRPVILELLPPGTAPRADSGERLLDLIGTALERDLAGRAAAPGELVIEKGWAAWQSDSLPPGSRVRHRDFPRSDAAELGLLTDTAGNYYDPASGWLWAPEPGGTEYVGSPAPAAFDVTAFSAPPASPEGPADAAPQLVENKEEPEPDASQASAVPPAGYAVSLGGEKSIVALSGLEPPADGSSLVLETSSAGGVFSSFDITRQVNAGTFVGVGSFGSLSGIRVTNFTNGSGNVLMSNGVFQKGMVPAGSKSN